jgi:pyruvate dehydrogenase E2 component (dihydrolipoamide acetyltransferase)
MSADAPAPTAAPKGAVETVEPTAADRTAARRAAEAKATIPDFQATVEVDVTDLRDAGEGIAIAPVVAAVGRALREVRRVNGAYVDGKVQLYSRANVGVVVGDGERRGVPTVLDADAKDPAAIAGELTAAAAAVQDGTLTAAVQAGATFTVASLAALDVASFVAIIAPGQAGALAVGAPQERVALRDGAPMVRHVATLTLSADARVVAPADAAAFLDRVRTALA